MLKVTFQSFQPDIMFQCCICDRCLVPDLPTAQLSINGRFLGYLCSDCMSSSVDELRELMLLKAEEIREDAESIYQEFLNNADILENAASDNSFDYPKQDELINSTLEQDKTDYFIEDACSQ